MGIRVGAASFFNQEPYLDDVALQHCKKVLLSELEHLKQWFKSKLDKFFLWAKSEHFQLTTLKMFNFEQQSTETY
jgi:hypothetical protein